MLTCPHCGKPVAFAVTLAAIDPSSNASWPSSGPRPQQRTTNKDSEPALFNNKLTLGVREAVRLLGISRAAMYAAVTAGEMPAVRVGRRWLVPVRALLARINASEQ
mgnify:CR=1 FL=1